MGMDVMSARVLTTNDDTLSAADIALGYKSMWIIEACFRKLKTTGLGIRPMFHWTPRRIVAQVTLRYSDERRDSGGKRLAQTPSTTLRDTHVFGRDGDRWLLAAFKPS